VAVPGTAAVLFVHETPGDGTAVTSPAGRLTLVGRTLEVRAEQAVRTDHKVAQ